jgi:hypothetical protein
MLEHVSWRHISKSEVGVFEELEVTIFDSFEELLFQLGLDVVEKPVFVDMLIEKVNGFGNLEASGGSVMHGCIARVDREKESNTGMGQVVCFGHEGAKMTIGAASSGGVDLSGIGIELLLQEAQSSVGGLTNDGD